ncbi:AfsA-related hotdog domain-containing protein [Azospirillum griseum]|uniref:A-factor biosynthesis hotdog domain-containing protein n=1 Tax=Azospirillum griseum TaxID=2496639 RepID=A0A431VIC9_9PROT|nr:AfsA-related hotdog domain-containing protein [Azospirillum griseum]RTR21095.1 hypothetical protein EJ903_10200 [Azospirillum griseum]
MTTLIDHASLPAFRLESLDGAGGFRAVPDTSHPFYFDHPLGHLPGLLLLDMALGAVERAADPDGGNGFWFNRFEVAFRALAALNLPLDIQVTDDGPDGAHRCTLSQRGRICAEFVGHGAVHRAAHPGDARESPAVLRPFTPVPPAAVRKLRPENVFLGNRRERECWPLAAAGRSASSLAAARNGVYRPVYLAECFLQLCRVSRAEAGAKPGVIPASREILVQLGGFLPHPLPDTNALSVTFDDHDQGGFFPRNHRSLRRTASILSDDDSICHFFCDAIVI